MIVGRPVVSVICWIIRTSAWTSVVSSRGVGRSPVGLVITKEGEIVGYTIGNDMSCRDIEGENPLYLPQAKIWKNSCSIGPAIRLSETVKNLLNQDHFREKLEVVEKGLDISKAEVERKPERKRKPKPKAAKEG